MESHKRAKPSFSSSSGATGNDSAPSPSLSSSGSSNGGGAATAAETANIATLSTTTTTTSPCPPTAATPTTVDPLTTFLHRDIRPQEGHRLLLPFLTTKDRLRVSECSQGLYNYRYHLTKVKVVKHPVPTPDNWRGLAQLLRGQRGLEYLHMVQRAMLHVLDLASEVCFKGLKTLHLHRLHLDDDGVGYLMRALRGDGLKGLEELNLSECTMACEDLEGILAVLQEGACPRLRRLRLGGAAARRSDEDAGLEGIGQAAAAALESGHLRHLQELDLWGDKLGEGGRAAIARALQRGACPQLIKLDMSWCHLLETDGGRALGEAMRSGSCAKLEELGLGRNHDVNDEGFMAIFGALEAGSCPSLKRLELYDTILSAPSATSLAHALRSGNCQHLQELDLADAFIDSDASLQVLQAIQQGGAETLPSLRYLDMSYARMDQEHGRVLGEAIEEGILPQLEELILSRNDALGDAGALPIMAGLEGGGCRHLKELGMADVGMGPQGGQALARALASGNLSCLDHIDLRGNEDIGDHAMAEVIKGLKECQTTMRFLDVALVGLGVESGEALLEILGRGGGWSNLESIIVYGNPDLGDGIAGGVGLAEVLEREGGRGKFPRLAGLWMKDCGLSQEGFSRLRGLWKGKVGPRFMSVSF